MADAQDAKSAEKGSGTEKKSNLTLCVFLSVVVLLLAGGGFYTYTTFWAPKKQQATESVQVKPEQFAEAVGEMFPLEPFVVNLSDPQGRRYLKVAISLELESSGAVDRATKMVPKLRDMVITLLTSLTFEEVMTPEGKVQIRDELLGRFNQILRPDRVRNIYFTDFVVQ
ncbi:MAG: flagellar basal body-associated FliL family protein [Deltaproteobacteria bacterium]